MTETFIAYSALAIGSFVGATLIPLSSEGLVAVYVTRGFDPASVILVATAANCLGITVNYLIGRKGRELSSRMFGARRVDAALERLGRYGTAGLLLSWVPVIGDPLTAAAGIASVPLRTFILVAFPLRLARYVVLVWPLLALSS